MAANLLAMASNLRAIASNLVAMASNLASSWRSCQSKTQKLLEVFFGIP